MQQRSNRASGPAQTPPRSAEVRVLANDVGGDVVFTHTWRDLAQPNEWKDPPIRLPRRTGPWRLNYELHDFTDKSLQFCATAKDSMWVRSGVKCPTSKGNGNHITFGEVTDGPNGSRTIMTVDDDNHGPKANLCYMLRFDSNNGQYEYDPDIKNGGTN